MSARDDLDRVTAPRRGSGAVSAPKDKPTNRARVVWREDGVLVDSGTAKRPYRLPAWADAEEQRLFDDVARRLLADQLDLDAGGAAPARRGGRHGDALDPGADLVPPLLDRAVVEDGVDVNGDGRVDDGG
jgi:hypothetical protein